MSLKIKTDFISCPICSEITKELLICKSCNSTLCKTCIKSIINNNKSLLKCPMCFKEIKSDNFIEDENLNKILEDLKFKCEKCEECFSITSQEIYQEHIKNCNKNYCKICNKSFKSKKCFYFHLYDDLHRKIIVMNFNKKELKLNENENKLFFNPENKKNFYENKDDNQSSNLLKLIDNIYINKTENNINKSNYINYDNDKITKIKSYFDNIQIINNNTNIEEFKKLNNNENNEINFDPNFNFFYCNSQLNCNCCKGKLCENNHCFCLNCMKLNKKFYGLNDNELINKYGRVCNLKLGYGYYCNCDFIQEYKNLNQFKFRKIFKCNFEDELCKACKELNNNLKIYLNDEDIDEIKKKRIKI